MSITNRKAWLGCSGWIASYLLSLPAVAPAQQIAIGGYPLPTAYAAPNGITSGPDGAIWFTEMGSGAIGRITTAGAITEYAAPVMASEPFAIIEGPDGALWFSEFSADYIGRITTTGTITNYPVPTFASGPNGITAGPDSALWFTEYNSNNIGRVTTGGAVTEYPVPTPTSQPFAIATGPDGALWFTESAGGKIGRLNTTGLITEYPLPSSGGLPEGIAAGPDGALWFTEYYGNKIGRITTAGVITEYSIPLNGGLSYPAMIAVGPDGAMWFTEYSNNIGRITTAGAITQYPAPGSGNSYGITTGPDGELWFTEPTLNKIGEAVFVTSGLSVSPSNGVYRTNLRFMDSTFAPMEHVQIYASGVGSPVLASTTADASGSFTISAHAPQSPYGPRLFLGVGRSSGKLGAASFSATPRLILQPNSGPVGTSAVALGFGFGPREAVDVYWQVYTLLGTGFANVNGTFDGKDALKFTVPTGAPAGPDQVVGIGEATHANAWTTFTVK